MEIPAVYRIGAATRAGGRALARLPLQWLLQALEASGASPDSRERLISTLNAWGSLPARVAAVHPDNRYVLEVAGARITVKLDKQHAVGDTVWLTLDESASSLREAPAGGEPRLSGAARLLARLISTEREQEPADSRPAAEARPVAASPEHTDEYAQKLNRAVSQSGLFYESHLARWAEGRYPFADLSQEPQALLATKREQAEQSLAASHPAPTSDPEVVEELVPLVRRQLETLERQSIVWTGLLWEAQHGELEIHSESDSRGGKREQPTTWHARLRLDLPGLGTIDTTVALRQGAAAVSISAAMRSTAATLLEAREELGTALQARGIRPDTILVKCDGE